MTTTEESVCQCTECAACRGPFAVRCRSQGCGHPYGMHYVTCDGEETGCHHFEDGLVDECGCCFCNEFLP